MDNLLPCARLDRSGMFVLCARIDCGTRLGSIFEIDLGSLCAGRGIDIETSDGSRRKVEVGDVFRSFVLPAGWRPSPSGVWELTRHAREAMRHGRPPMYRRPFAEIPGGMRRQHDVVPMIPTQIECPSCHLEQVLDQGQLRLTERPFALIPSDSFIGWFVKEEAGA